MKENGLNRYVYDFSVDYNAIAVDDFIRYSQVFSEKGWVIQNVWFVKQIFV